jgi:tRNA threonylcarbamoyladenosine biosynthesis protein TsaB
MRILGLDTATRATTVALLQTSTGAALERRDDPPPGSRPRHTTRLLELIAEVLEATGTGWADIDLLAAGVGPGTFTGLRIGIATARALASAREIPLVGVSTLDSLTLGATGPAASAAPVHDAIVAVLDARRREVFAAGWAVHRRGGEVADRELLLEPCATAPAALAQTIAGSGRTWLAVGEGAVEFRHVLEGSGALIPGDDSLLHRVSAIEHCRVGEGLRPESPGEVRPQYLRLPDAELALRFSRQR